jgi:cyclopropane-fatty-acyl-phospholipid synthase
VVSPKSSLTQFAIQLAEKQQFPDRLIRGGIRQLLKNRLRTLSASVEGAPDRYHQEFMKRLQAAGIAKDTDAANEQHYEIPDAFFATVLGHRLKYSSCLYEANDTLDQAENRMLSLTAKRAELSAARQVLELGCGWGSLTLWMLEYFPDLKITAMSNSASQQAHIIKTAESHGWSDRLDVVRCDINAFEPRRTFDRIVSIEMFEHVRNYPQLFQRMADWMEPGGKLFVHVFSHCSIPYLFENRGSADWMARHFFTGGTMPSHNLLPQCCEPLALEANWRIDGMHYAKTSEDWLRNMDHRESRVREILAQVYPAHEVEIWIQRWRMFFMACAELFAFDKGSEWGVSHYRFVKQEDA